MKQNQKVSTAFSTELMLMPKSICTVSMPSHLHFAPHHQPKLSQPSYERPELESSGGDINARLSMIITKAEWFISLLWKRENYNH